LGTLVDLKRVVELARKVDAKVCVDAAQLVAHRLIDVNELGIDFLVFSSHKIYGPTGAGVLWGRRELLEAMEPWMGGGDMIREVSLEGSTWNDIPWKFEAGTPPIAQVLGMGAAIEFLYEVGMDKIQAHDCELMLYAREKMEAMGGVSLLGPENAVGVLSFEVEGVHPHDVSAILGASGVCVRAGHHCTMPLMKALGVAGTTRASFGIYNNKSDVDRLVKGLEKVKETFGN
jgi:cysteine desulfurase/selenocysteine lyase